MVRVNEMRHPVAHTIGLANLVYCSLDVVADRRRSVEQNDAVWRGQEPTLVNAVGHPVQVALYVTDVIAQFVHRRSEDDSGIGAYAGRVSALTAFVSMDMIHSSFR